MEEEGSGEMIIIGKSSKCPTCGDEHTRFITEDTGRMKTTWRGFWWMILCAGVLEVAVVLACVAVAVAALWMMAMGM